MSFSVTSKSGTSQTQQPQKTEQKQEAPSQNAASSPSAGKLGAVRTGAYKEVHQKADGDNNGSLTRQEFDAYQNNYLNPDYSSDLTRSFEHDVAASDIDLYFKSIANRALKEGEVTTMDYRPTDATIELADLDRLANFDGNAASISLDDLSQLQHQPDAIPVEPDGGIGDGAGPIGDNPFPGGCIPPDTRESVYNELASYLTNYFSQGPFGALFQQLGFGSGPSQQDYGYGSPDYGYSPLPFGNYEVPSFSPNNSGLSYIF